MTRDLPTCWLVQGGVVIAIATGCATADGGDDTTAGVWTLTTGDGDGDGDGDPTGDGDGDPTTGDGDGDPTTGDGDGDPTTGDGDGDAESCAAYGCSNEYVAEQTCQCDPGCVEAGDCCADVLEAECACVDNFDCSATEVCSANGCVPALEQTYEVWVHALSGVECSDGVGEAEVYWILFSGDEFIEESGVDSCPLAWNASSAPYDAAVNLPAQWDFYELDAIEDDYLTSFCWGNPCAPVPATVLHDGGWAGNFGNSMYIELTFDVVP